MKTETYAERLIQMKTDKISSKCVMTIGRVLLEELERNLMFNTQMTEWDKALTPMQDLNQFNQKALDKLEHDLLDMHDLDTTEAEKI